MCNITKLHYRRIRGVRNIQDSYGNDVAVSPKLEKSLNTYITGDNDSRLHKRRSRIYCYTNRVVNVWNSWPNWVVSAD